MTASELLEVVRRQTMHQKTWVHLLVLHLQVLQPRGVILGNGKSLGPNGK